MKTNWTYVGQTDSRTLRIGLAVFLSLVGTGGSVNSQSPEYTSQLYDACVDVARLTPETQQTRSGEATFLVDDPSIVNVEIYSDLAGLTTSIDGPGALVVDPQSVTTIGGVYRDYHVSGTQAEMCLFLQTMCEPGYHYQYSFPSQGPGNYVVKFTAPSGMGGATEGAVITRFDTSSTAAAAIIPTQTRLKNGETVVLTAIVGDGTSAITGATVTVRLKTPSSDEFDTTFSLLDNGNIVANGDNLLNDGLYSGTYITAEVGEYGVLAEINGTTLLGNAFYRQVGTSFEVYDPPAVFNQPLVLSDAGVDDTPANGLFELLEISAEVTVHSGNSGEYTMTVVLTTGAGDLLVGRGQASLASGSPLTITADIPAQTLIERDQWGQYTITELDLTYFGSSGDDPPILADRIVNVGVLTSSYQKEDFERERISILEELISSEATDNIAPTGYEELAFTVPLDILFDGTYSYSAGLFASCGLDVNGFEVFSLIEIVTGELVVSGAPATVNWVLTFDGGLIGASGLDGPYSVQNASIYGPASIVVMELAEDESNPVYLSSDFEGWTGLPDCNANWIADICDLALDPGADCDQNGFPDDCPGEDPVSMGACCDGEAAVCTDDVRECDCPYRFEEDVLCADLDPLCATACCRPDESCENLTEAQCLAEGGAPILGKLCAPDNVVCYASCFTATNCCYLRQPEPVVQEVGVIGCSDPVICSTVCASGSFFDDCCGDGNYYHWGTHCRNEAVQLYEESLGELPNCNNNLNNNINPAYPPDEYYDMCEVEDGTAFDCNGNGVPDDCDISDGTSTDCDENQVPDECESGACCDMVTGDCFENVSACDCNGNFELGATCASLQTPCTWACCQPNDICTDETFDQCQTAGGVLAPGVQCLDQGFPCPSCVGVSGCCYEANGVTACGDANCCGSVCLIDPYCCDTTWDSLCVGEAFDLCDPLEIDECLEMPLPDPMTCSDDSDCDGSPEACSTDGICTCNMDDDCDPGAKCEQGFCYIPKNRYLSFQPNNFGEVAFQVVMTESAQFGHCTLITGWVQAPVNGISRLTGNPVTRIWTESVVHVSDYEIVPASTYEIRATHNGGVTFSTELVIHSTPRPGTKWWGDVVGAFDNTRWRPPNGVVNIDDTVAAIKTYLDSNAFNATHFSITDLVGTNGAFVYGIVNINDVLMIIMGFQGKCYRFPIPSVPCEPSDEGCPPVQEFLSDPSTLSLLASAGPIKQNELFDVDVYIDAAASLAAYQLALEVADGDTGSLDLEGRFIDTTRTDYVFRTVTSSEIVDDVGGHVAGYRTDGEGSSFSGPPPSYLGTFQFRASGDALGVFTINFQNEEDNFLLNENGGALVNTVTIPVTVDVLCDDGNPCTDDLVVNDICTHVNNDTNTCTDGDDCTSDACVSGVCTSSNEPVGTACDDGLFCTATDECDGSGTCVGSGSPCAPKNPYCCESLSSCGAVPCS